MLGDQQLAAPAHRGFPYRDFGYFGRAALTQDFSVLPPTALLLSRHAVIAAGGLLPEPVMAPHWWVDLCLRLRAASGRLVFSPFAALRMAEKARRGADPWPGSPAEVADSEQQLRAQWQTWIDADPAFSPNLSTHPINFSLAWPARTRRWSELRGAKPHHPLE